MRLWRRAAGALKDKNSLWVAELSSKTSYRNPDLEKAIIKATSHDERFLDYKNTQRVFTWIRTNHLYVKPLFTSLSRRMERTHCWAVALKGLILLHGVFSCKVPAVQKIGRLPFDFSSFEDNKTKVWGFNAFVRSYYAFLDKKSVYMNIDVQECCQQRCKKMDEHTFLHEIMRLQRWQALLDLMLQIRPTNREMWIGLILEAMDCIVTETYEVYSKICGGIARILMKIYFARKNEAIMALKVLQKARDQSEELSDYFDFCKLIGVFTSSSEFPKVEQIPEEDIEDIERLIYGVPKKEVQECVVEPQEEEKSIIVTENSSSIVEYKDPKTSLTTIITHQWETFDEDLNFVGSNDVPLLDYKPPQAPSYNLDDLPDLITF